MARYEQSVVKVLIDANPDHQICDRCYCCDARLGVILHAGNVADLNRNQRRLSTILAQGLRKRQRANVQSRIGGWDDSRSAFPAGERERKGSDGQ